MKQCNKCQNFKSLNDFYNLKSAKDGKQNKCIKCIKVYYIENKDKILDYQSSYQKTNKKQVNKYKLKYYHKNSDLINRERRENEELKLYLKNYRKKKFEDRDVNFLLPRYLRTRLYNALKNNSKTGSAVRDLGCTIEELKQYFELKFQSGMTWENYGQWHIDHIKPLASFDLTNDTQLLEVCNYTNLQPLWAKDNLKKGMRNNDKK